MKQIILVIFIFSITACSYGAERIAPTVLPLSGEELKLFFESKIENNSVTLLHRALVCNQTFARATAAERLGLKAKAESVPYLIDALSDNTMYVGGGKACFGKPGENTTRYWANVALKKITGKDFEYQWDAESEERKKSILKWKEWYELRKKKS